MKNFRIVATLLVVFTVGAASGALGTRSILLERFRLIQAGPTEKHVELLMKRFDQKLALTETQEQQLRAVLVSAMEQIHVVRQQVDPQIKEIIAESNKEVMTILDEEQDEIFLRLLKNKFKDVQM